MAAVENDDLSRLCAAYIVKTVQRALSLAPPGLNIPIQARLIGFLVAGYAFMSKQTLDEAWVELRAHAIAEQLNYEANIKPILDARDQRKS